MSAVILPMPVAAAPQPPTKANGRPLLGAIYGMFNGAAAARRGEPEGAALALAGALRIDATVRRYRWDDRNNCLDMLEGITGAQDIVYEAAAGAAAAIAADEAGDMWFAEPAAVTARLEHHGRLAEAMAVLARAHDHVREEEERLLGARDWVQIMLDEHFPGGAGLPPDGDDAA